MDSYFNKEVDQFDKLSICFCNCNVAKTFLNWSQDHTPEGANHFDCKKKSFVIFKDIWHLQWKLYFYLRAALFNCIGKNYFRFIFAPLNFWVTRKRNSSLHLISNQKALENRKSTRKIWCCDIYNFCLRYFIYFWYLIRPYRKLRLIFALSEVLRLFCFLKNNATACDPPKICWHLAESVHFMPANRKFPVAWISWSDGPHHPNLRNSFFKTFPHSLADLMRWV